MKHLIQQGKLCTVYAAAMVFNVEPDEILKSLGHDAKKGVHMQELQRFAIGRGEGLVLFEFKPVLEEEPIDVWQEPLTPLDLGYSGIILGYTLAGAPHAVAWDGEKIFDPSPNPSFKYMQYFWALVKL